MFNEKQSMVIVYRKQEAEYAHLMANLISENHNYEVARWEIKDWAANKSAATASQKVVFLGDTKEARLRIKSIKWKYDKFGMKYGWLGNECTVITEPIESDKQEEFFNLYKAETGRFEQLPTKYIDNLEEDDNLVNADTENPNEAEDDNADAPTGEDKKINKLFNAVGAVAGKAVETSGNVTGFFKNKKNMGICQYNLLICEFVINDGLKQFMEA